MIDLIKKGIKEPKKIAPFIRRQLLFGPNTLYNRIIRGKNGINIMEEDWDNLIILDGCRYDAFQEIASEIPGRLTKQISRGSSSVEWINNTFADRNFHDTVYITANPYIKIETNNQFHDVWHAWETHWNEEHFTVLPSTLAGLALEAEEEYPNKRIITHFMQPHRPFIGEKGKKIEDTRGNKGHRNKALNKDHTWEGKSVFAQLKSGNIDRETVWEAYIENLNYVLPHLKNLITNIDGKTVITADHGNGFGERPPGCFGRIYAHPSRVFARELVEIPWHVIDGERREINSESPNNTGSTEENSNRIEDRLEALGYR